jgi:hypothetical protein
MGQSLVLDVFIPIAKFTNILNVIYFSETCRDHTKWLNTKWQDLFMISYLGVDPYLEGDYKIKYMQCDKLDRFIKHKNTVFHYSEPITNIVELLQLKALSLYNCELELPKEFGLLTELEDISLNYVPSNFNFCRLTRLKNLAMNYCNLDSIPEFVFDLTNLRYLNVNNNPITQIPEKILAMPNLKELHIINCHIPFDKLLWLFNRGIAIHCY